LCVVQTAGHIAAHHRGTSVIKDPRIREKGCGIHEGQKVGSQNKAAAKAGVRRRKYRPPHGENIGENRADMDRSVLGKYQDFFFFFFFFFVISNFRLFLSHFLIF
jgi:broad specificity phosphatase PhoE